MIDIAKEDFWRIGRIIRDNVHGDDDLRELVRLGEVACDRNVRLTAERDAAVAANAALMVRIEEARRLIDRALWRVGDGKAARAWLAVEGK